MRVGPVVAVMAVAAGLCPQAGQAQTYYYTDPGQPYAGYGYGYSQPYRQPIYPNQGFFNNQVQPDPGYGYDRSDWLERRREWQWRQDRDADRRYRDQRRSELETHERQERQQDVVRRQQQYNQSVVQLQQQHNQGVVGLQQQFNQGAINRQQLEQGYQTLERNLNSAIQQQQRTLPR